jgi:hypothetical protein
MSQKDPGYNRMPSRNAGASLDATQLLSMPTEGGPVTVVVFKYANMMFVNAIDLVYSQVENAWVDTTRTEMPIALEDFRVYMYLAARTRISVVNNERRDQWPLRTNDDWCIPASIVNVINSVGRVFDETTASEIIPVWPEDPALPGYEAVIQMAASRGRVDLIDFQVGQTMVLRRIKSHLDRVANVPVLFVDAIARERNGDPDVMMLVPSYGVILDGELGNEPVHLHARGGSGRMVNGTVAFTFLSWAMWPSVYQRNTVDTHPLENPGDKYITSSAVKSTWVRLFIRAS